MAKNDIRDKGVDREGCVDSGHRSKEIPKFIFLMLLVIIIRNLLRKVEFRTMSWQTPVKNFIFSKVPKN